MKSASLRPVVPADFDPIHDALLRELNPRFTRERWRRIFHWGWENPEDHVGFALVTGDGDYVGYAGTVYSDQEIEGRVERICNITSWIVKDGYRSQALALVMPVLRRSDLTITNLTSLDTVNDMFLKLGFRNLETHTRVFLPWGGGFPLGGGDRGVRLHRDVESLPASTPATVLADVSALAAACHHWVVESQNRWCHVAFTVGRRRRIRSLRIHHISDPDLFVETLSTLRAGFLRSFQAPLFECDDRFMGDRILPGSRRIAMPVSRLFRSPRLARHQISNLRSELSLLNL